MALFKRKGTVAAQDEAFPFLTVDEAGEVRRLAARAFATAGLEVVIRPDHLEASDGQVYGLWNVAAACKASGPRSGWPGMVEAHVSSLLSAPASTDGMSVEEILAHAMLRVYGTDTIPAGARAKLTHAREFAEGLLEAVVLDTPTTVMSLFDEDVERCGRSALWAAGLEHLLAEPLGEVSRRDVPSGAVIHVLEGESVYTASKVLVLPDVLRRVFGERPFPDGILVALPGRHRLMLHPLDDATVITAVQAMVVLAADFYASAQGGVTPSVYWWRDGEFERLSSYDEEGNLCIAVHAAFGEVLDRLTTVD